MGLKRYCYDCHTDQHWPCGGDAVTKDAVTDTSESRLPDFLDTVTDAHGRTRRRSRKGALRSQRGDQPGEQSASGLRHCPTCTCGEKRVHATNADRQKAYRERKAKTV